MTYTIYELLWMFLIYAFLGWCAEVIFHAVEVGDFANRGFLNGPVCPIYGFGATLVIAVLSRVENVFVMFFVSMVLTSLLELITGFVLKKLYHTSWWDYSDKPFNLGGYICLEFSILWGLACVGVTELVHPLIMTAIDIVPQFVGKLLLAFFTAVLVSDVIVTAAALGSLAKRVRALDDLAAAIRRVSDDIGGELYEKVSEAEKRNDKIKESDEVKALKRRYEELSAERHVIHSRIIKAFPKMKSLNYGEHLDRIREKASAKNRK